MASISYLTTFVAAIIGMAGLYFGLFVYQLGAPVAAEYWVHEAKTAKIFLAGQGSGQRVLILGGSNALFGIDSGLVEKQIGMHTVNLAIHGGLSLPYMFEYIKPVLRPRDVVVMPLEIEYYASAYRYDWFRSNIMAWDPGYVRELALLERARFVLAVPMKRVVNGAIAQMYAAQLRRQHGRFVRDVAVITREAIGIWQAESYVGKPITYSLSSLDGHGDMQNNRGTRYTGPADSVLSATFTYASDVWVQLENFAAYCRGHNVTLFMAWPAFMTDPGLGAGNPAVPRNVAHIVSHLEKARIGVLGRPQDYYLDRVNFFDTKYHLNEEGRTIRTGQLVRDLRDALWKGETGPLP
jgi:hypothetical protein